ncbi:Kef-type K+ transport system, membrane component [Halalkaliarchaeum desulfuricum]|uniref:Kef-type K+ transport system, membrane component n=1 Tax=Halalkaliarchaeum desulfuricum TaxID=2055893 RepID=A0A343THX7_9EURY|nr:cation:proton antiporter [Halalkaliarchaeum desulfuricum]AUX08699.1 Kef-type K+ transport system, membrane component [Halalkaliarchaeum desulfuricum]
MSEMLTAVAIIFIVAGPFLLFANRYDLPAAPLLVLAGIVAGFFIDEALALELAQFGIALLVFTFGVGIQLSSIEIVLADSELTALGQILVVGALGIGFGVLFGIPLGEAIYLGVAVALSSTIVGTALLQTEIRTDLIRGRLGESIQFVQDLFAVAFILVVGAGVLELDPIVLQIGYGAVFLVGAVLVNRYVFDAMGRLAGGSDELMIVGVVSLLVVFVGAAAAVGIPIVVGAFAAGLAVRHEPGEYLGLFNGLESIKDFFVAIFFVTVGALVVLPFVQLGVAESVEKLALVAGVVLLAVLVKPAVTTTILMYRGYEARTATLTALSTDQISEFSLIIAIEALLVGLLTQAVFDAIVLATAVTMITSTVTQRYNERIYRMLSTRGLVSVRHDKIDELSDVPEDISDHVIIVGYGRKGRRMVETCEELNHPYVVIENDPALREEVRIDCEAYVFGDAMGDYTWEKANADEARVIVSVSGSGVISRRLLELEYDATLVLRARDERTALSLLDAGATYVAVPDLLAGQQLIQYVRGLLEGDLSAEELRTEGIAELEEPVRLIL